MNDSLKNTAIEEIQSIGEIGDTIIQNIADNAHGFETFVELLNRTRWQSQKELTDIWIRKVAGKEYDELLSENKNPKIAEVRACAIDMISRYAFDALHECTQNLSRWQQIKSKFLVRYTLARELPISEQDRILATEMGVSYEIWRQMLGFFSHNMDYINLLQLQETSLEGAIADGEKGFVLIAPEGDPEQISSLGDLPGVELIYQSDTENTPLLFIGEEVFRRYDKIIRLKEKETIIRDIVHNRLGGNIYVYKRFLGGDVK